MRFRLDACRRHSESFAHLFCPLCCREDAEDKLSGVKEETSKQDRSTHGWLQYRQRAIINAPQIVFGHGKRYPGISLGTVGRMEEVRGKAQIAPYMERTKIISVVGCVTTQNRAIAWTADKEACGRRHQEIQEP